MNQMESAGCAGQEADQQTPEHVLLDCPLLWRTLRDLAWPDEAALAKQLWGQ
jgi:hypothetical protein